MSRESTAIMRPYTIGQHVDLAKGMCSGFDALRIILAVMVILWHGIVSSYGSPAEQVVLESPGRVLVHMMLPAFFALSGFLVSGSLLRSRSMIGFMTLRVVRIVPALSVEVVLGALILGPLVTSLPLWDYFTSASFASYFLNAIGLIQFQLPGVFLDNPLPDVVNLSLWTVPYELECYLALAVLATLGLVWRPALLLALVVAAGIVLPASHYARGLVIDWFTQPHGRLLVLAFIAGVAIFQLRHRIPRRLDLFLASLVLALALLYHPRASFLAALPVAYATVWLGTLNVPRAYLPKGDYSYGIYLYAFPMQQLYAHLFAGNLSWLGNVTFALPASFACAYLSWHLVEKRVLARKKVLVAATQSSWDRTFGRLTSRFALRAIRPAE